MDKETEKFVNDLMDKNEYFIDVVLIEQEGRSYLFEVNYCNKLIEHYQVDYETSLVTYYDITEELEEGVTGEVFFVPDYLVRIFLFYSIIRQAKKLKLPLSIVRFYDFEGEQKNSIDEIMPINEGERVSALEQLCDVVAANIYENKKSINHFDGELRENNVYNNFLMIKGLLV